MGEYRHPDWEASAGLFIPPGKAWLVGILQSGSSLHFGGNSCEAVAGGSGPRISECGSRSDDSEGVSLEGERHGFAVVVVSPEDVGWAVRVLEVVERKAGAVKRPGRYRV